MLPKFYILHAQGCPVGARVNATCQNPMWIGLCLKVVSFKYLMLEGRTFLPCSLATIKTLNAAKALNKEEGGKLGRFLYFL